MKSGAVAAPVPAVVPAPAAPAPVKPAPAVAPAARAAPVIIPAGTSLLVRNIDAVSSKSAVGSRFGLVVDADVVLGGTVFVKAGAKGYGKVVQAKQAGRAVGKSSLAITLTDVEINGTLSPVLTDVLGDEGSGSGKKTAGGAAVGAVIGGVAGGGQGAATGAAIGAGVSLLKKGETVGVAPNTLLEFRTQKPITVN